MTETQWITLIETADIIKTLPTKVARMCEEGKLEYYKEGDHYFISRESIDFFIESQDDESVLSHNKASETIPEEKQTPDLGASSQTENNFPTAIEGSNGTPQRRYGEPSEKPEEAVELTHNYQPSTINNDEKERSADGPIGEPEEQTSKAVENSYEILKQPLEEQYQKPSPHLRDSENNPLATIVANLRDTISAHASQEKAFYDDMINLLEVLEKTLSSSEEKTTELTREIAKLLAQYGDPK